jgi:ribonuclease-3
VPVYHVLESGPDHAKSFSATVAIDADDYGPGAGRNKKEAEQNAAALAFAALKARQTEALAADGVTA